MRSIYRPSFVKSYPSLWTGLKMSLCRFVPHTYRQSLYFTYASRNRTRSFPENNTKPLQKRLSLGCNPPLGSTLCAFCSPFKTYISLFRWNISFVFQPRQRIPLLWELYESEVVIWVCFVVPLSVWYEIALYLSIKLTEQRT